MDNTKWAPESILNDLNIKVRSVQPNPKTGKSRARYDNHAVGQTIGTYIRKCVADGTPESLARMDIRWDVRHGLITLGY
jgi:hypothetical protein